MGELYKSRALVLCRRPFREADEVVHLLTPQKGRLDVMVRGSKRLQSAWVGRLEPFVEFDGLFAKGRSFSYLSQGRTLYTYPLLRQDYRRLCWGSFLLEMWSEAIPKQQAASREYALLVRTLHALEATDNLCLTCCWAEWNLMLLWGNRPSLEGCARCGEARPVGYSFSEGGLVCEACLERTCYLYGAHLGRFLEPRLMLLLQRLPYLTLEKAQSVALPAPEAAQLEDILWQHWCYSGHAPVRSRRLLRELD